MDQGDWEWRLQLGMEHGGARQTWPVTLCWRMATSMDVGETTLGELRAGSMSLAEGCLVADTRKGLLVVTVNDEGMMRVRW